MTNRDRFDAGAPHAPAAAEEWGRLISDAVDDLAASGTNVPEPTGAAEGDLFIMRITASGYEWVQVTEDEV